MRPNLALGPIDSLSQYLIYVSIVVLGVLLPLLVQRWRQARQNANLADRTLRALTDELTSNRDRLVVSRASFDELADALRQEYGRYEKRWRELRATPEAPLPDAEFEKGPENSVRLSALTHTAWEIAHLSQALPLLPAERLAAFTRAYHLQELYAESRALYLESTMRAEALDTPADLRQIANVEHRLRCLAVLQSAVRYHRAITSTVLEAYERAIAASPTPDASRQAT